MLACALVGPPAMADLTGSCAVRFKGYSTLHDFEGTVASRPFAIRVATNAAGATLLGATIEVPAAEMNTQHEARDKKMHEAMKVAACPLVSATVTNLSPDAARGSAGTPGSLPFTLHITGKSYPVVGRIDHWQETPKSVQFDMSFAVSLAEAGIVIPSVLGVIKVKDGVDVIVHVQVSKEPAGQPETR